MASKGLSANFAAMTGSGEHRQSPGSLPTLLSASRRSAPAESCTGRFRKALEIAIPEPERELQAYPAEAVHVRNTFIHIASPAVSLNRATVSCPSSHIGRLHKTFQTEEGTAENSLPPSSKHVLCLSAVLGETAFPSTPEPLSMSGMVLPPSCYGSPEKLSLPAHFQEGAEGHMMVCREWQPEHLPAQPQQTRPERWYQGPGFHSQPPQCVVQMTSPALPLPPPPQVQGPEPAICPMAMPAPTEPAPGSAELPSIGSKLHHAGECKPCAFLHIKGCDNGAMCKFCHLCDAGEKKRRQKAKKAAFKFGGA